VIKKRNKPIIYIFIDLKRRVSFTYVPWGIKTS